MDHLTRRGRLHPSSGRLLAYITALSAAIIGAGCRMDAGRRQGKDEAPPGTSAECPRQSPKEWQDFIDLAAAETKWVDTCEDSTCDVEFYKNVKDNIQSVFDKCAALLEQNSTLRKCTQNLRDFVPAWTAQHSSDSYGFTLGNHAYLAAQEAADKPQNMMKVPPELVAAVPDPAKVVAAAQANGWKYLTHNSALGGSRTFIMIPDIDDRFDRWMLLNLQDKSVKTETPLSFIAVQKKNRDGQPLPKVRLNFRDYTLTQGDAGYRLTIDESRNGKCYACHVSGMRKLIHRRTPILEAAPVKGESGYGKSPPADFAWNRLQEFNARIAAYGLNDWDGAIVPEHHGPPLGEEFGCTHCHDGKIRSIITLSTSTAQLEQKLYYELSMPPGDHDAIALLERSEMSNPVLSQSEKDTLANVQDEHEQITEAFENARGPSLQKWLTATPCQ